MPKIVTASWHAGGRALDERFGVQKREEGNKLTKMNIFVFAIFKNIQVEVQYWWKDIWKENIYVRERELQNESE